MSERTKVEQWFDRLKRDCPVFTYTGKHSGFMGHIHDLAECGYMRAEEVAYDVWIAQQEIKQLREGYDGLYAEVANRHDRIAALEAAATGGATGAGDPFGAWMAVYGPVQLNAIIRIAHPALLRHLGGEDEELKDLYDALIRLGAALRPYEDQAQPLVARALNSAATGGATGADDPVCARYDCGHKRSRHTVDGCNGIHSMGELCQCGKFTPAAATPEPRVTPAVDPVLTFRFTKSATIGIREALYRRNRLLYDEFVKQLDEQGAW